MDTISTLPLDISARILTLLPIQDVLRTSVLSKKWRYRWTSIPVLKFDDKNMFQGSSQHKEIVKYKFANVIYRVLLLHSGPLLEFTLECNVEMASEFDMIILYLSRNKTLKKFTFNNNITNNYKLPSSFFSLRGLEYIDILNCHFDPPLTFNGFSKLTWLCITNVKITTEMLKHFLTNCPLLEYFYLLGDNKDITRGNKLTFVELFECLPSLVLFGLSVFYMEYFAAGGIPKILPIPLVHLKTIILGLCFTKQDELLSTLCLINNSPNLVEIFLSLVFEPTFMDVVDLQDYSSLKLDHLEVLEIVGFNNSANEIEFVKLVMAKSHVLEVVRLQLSANFSADEELRMLRDWIRFPFPRASPLGKLIIDPYRPETYS